MLASKRASIVTRSKLDSTQSKGQAESKKQPRALPEKDSIGTHLAQAQKQVRALKEKMPKIAKRDLWKRLSQDMKSPHAVALSTIKSHHSILAATKRVGLKFPKSQQILDDIPPEYLSVNQTNETFSAVSADDYNEDRSKESVFSQVELNHDWYSVS